MNSKFSANPMEALGFTHPVLSGQTAVITGGGSGIGRELCLILAELGATVVVAEINPEGADTAHSINSRGGQARFIQTDVRSEESVRALFAAIRTDRDTVHILVNNAAYSPVIPLEKMSADDWDQVMAVNLRGTFLCSRYALEMMKPQNQGTIVNLISAPVMPYLTAYTAAKEGIHSLVHSLAGELEDTNICVIGYGPGMVETPGGTAAFEKLAPLIEIPYEELIHSGFNPGYEGLIPAYDAALVLANLISRPKSFHNRTVTIEEAASAIPVQGESLPDDTDYDCEQLVHLLSSVHAQSQELLSAVEATDEEFNRLPFFVRTMARSGFRRKVGVAVGDLKNLLEEIYQTSGTIVQTLADNQNDPEDIPRTDISHCLQNCSQIVSVLSELEQYYVEVPAEMSRFIRDEKALRQVLETCQERVQKTQSMRSAAESARKS